MWSCALCSPTIPQSARSACSRRTAGLPKVIVSHGNTSSLSRQGHPRIAHRFNGGRASSGTPMSPVRDGRSGRSPWPRAVGVGPPCEILSPLTGLGPDMSVYPTDESVGYCRVSLPGQRAAMVLACSSIPCEFPVFYTWEALPIGRPFQAVLSGNWPAPIRSPASIVNPSRPALPHRVDVR